MNGYPNNSRICFIGDSLVAQNHYLPRIIDFYIRNFPTANIRFFNCGTAGGTVRFALDSFDDDVALHNPTHAVVAFGVNDSNRWVLENSRGIERYETLKKSFEAYKKNLEALCDKIIDAGIELTLCTPAPYDEYARTDSSRLNGGYALLLGYADFVRELVRRKGINLCDFHAYLSEIMQNENLYTPDRVHLTEYGYSFMARCFLENQGLEYSSSDYCDERFKNWKTAVEDLRDHYAVECMIIRNYTMPIDEKISLLEDYVEKQRWQTQYFERISKKYLQNVSTKKQLETQIENIYENEILVFEKISRNDQSDR